jgi:hypothetical protein
MALPGAAEKVHADGWRIARRACRNAILRRQERRRMRDTRKEQEDEDARFTTSLAGLAVTLFLAVVGLYLLEALSTESKLEDCLLQGRMNCLPVDVTAFSQ